MSVIKKKKKFSDELKTAVHVAWGGTELSPFTKSVVERGGNYCRERQMYVRYAELCQLQGPVLANVITSV